MTEPLDPRHASARSTLRIVGPVIAGLGLILTLIGFISFFASFGSFERPRFFWCAFLGLPMLGVGLILCKMAFLGSITRYVANEVAPVGKDVVNYMAKGTKGAMRDVAAALGEGWRGTPPARTCLKCRTENDAEARFCKACGAALATRCPACGAECGADAQFCDQCGKPVA